MPSALVVGGVATAFQRPAPGEIDVLTLAAAIAGGIVALGVATLVAARPRPRHTRRITAEPDDSATPQIPAAPRGQAIHDLGRGEAVQAMSR